jgi:hypothetical protein
MAGRFPGPTVGVIGHHEHFAWSQTESAFEDRNVAVDVGLPKRDPQVVGSGTDQHFAGHVQWPILARSGPV